MKILRILSVMAITMTIVSAPCWGAQPAFDSGRNYDGSGEPAWVQGANAGTGFGSPWAHDRVGATATAWVGSSRVDDNGMSFGLTAPNTSGSAYTVSRTFDGFLNVGDTVSWRFDPISVEGTGRLSFNMSNTSGVLAFSLFTTSTSPTYLYSAALGNNNTGISSTAAVTADFTLTDNVGGFVLGITPVGGTRTVIVDGTHTGDIYGFDVKATRGSLAFNNVSVVPEPAGLAALGIAALVLSRRRRS